MGQPNPSGILFMAGVGMAIVAGLWFLITGEIWQLGPMLITLLLGLLAAKALTRK